MKRKNKLVLIVVIVALYIVISLNFNKIKFMMNMVDLYNKEKKTENIAGNHNDDENIVLHNPLENIIATETNNDEKHTADTPSPSKPQLDSKVPYVDIVREYNSKFESLRSSFEGDLDNLLAQGAAEYSSGNLSTAKLAAKYMSTGADLEKSSDVNFKVVLKDMEKELKNNGHDTNIIKEIESYYSSFKNSKKTALINKGLDYIN